MTSQFEVRIVWGDCDEQGIVFYPKYFYWMDSAFQALLRDAGQSVRGIREGFGHCRHSDRRGQCPLSRIDDPRRSSQDRSRDPALGRKVACVPSTGDFVATGLIFEGFEARVWLGRASDGRPRGGHHSRSSSRTPSLRPGHPGPHPDLRRQPRRSAPHAVTVTSRGANICEQQLNGIHCSIAQTRARKSRWLPSVATHAK